jgi:hypothetical protein
MNTPHGSLRRRWIVILKLRLLKNRRVGCGLDLSFSIYCLPAGFNEDGTEYSVSIKGKESLRQKKSLP